METEGRTIRRARSWMGRLAAVLTLSAVCATNAASQQTATLEYYLSPSAGGTNQMQIAGPDLALTADLAGTTLTFTNDPFSGQFVADGTVEVSVSINAVAPGLPATPPGAAATIDLAGGDYRLVSPQGEVIEGTLSDQSALELEPYAPVPRVMFFKAIFVPDSTSIQGGANGIVGTMQSMVVWGLMVTNGVDFTNAVMLPSTHEYHLDVVVN